MTQYSELKQALQPHLNWHGARCCLSSNPKTLASIEFKVDMAVKCANRCHMPMSQYLEHRFSIQNSVQFLDFGISQKAIFR